MAGVDWLRGFRKRNPSISLRIPEATSAARASAFNKPQVQKYFRCLTATIDEFKFEPQQIWNVDESGFTTVPSQHPKIFATKGRKQVGILTSAETVSYTHLDVYKRQHTHRELYVLELTVSHLINL